MQNLIILASLLLCTTVHASPFTDCDQVCSENKGTNLDTRLNCVQLCVINLNLEKIQILLANDIVNHKEFSQKMLNNEAYINDVTEEVKNGK